MGYEKLYKGALKRAKGIIKYYKEHNRGDEAAIEDLEVVFPELKESEYERIRKGIIGVVKGTMPDNDYRKKYLDWLEKQSQEDMVEALRMEYEKGKSDVLQEQRKEWNEEDERIIEWLIHDIKNALDDCIYNGESVEDAEKALAWLEKQNKQILANSAKTCKDEQKPTDNNKPKFKVGDWINGYYASYKVLSVNNKWYAVEDTDGNKINILFENEKFHHLWTIQDANDGDVLYSPCLSLLWIFKSKDTVYCGCNLNYNDGAFCGEGYFERPTDAIPATKEQREQLEKVITDAGYKWNKEQLKLEKI